MGDVDDEGAVIGAGDDEVGKIALTSIGQLDTDASPTNDIGVDVEKGMRSRGRPGSGRLESWCI
jgi:hypothetical protein